MQVLNVAMGGTLLQHLDDHMVMEGYNATIHDVRIESCTVLAGVMNGAASLGVNSLHHQAIDDVGDGLRVTAWAHDGTVEAVEVIDGAGGARRAVASRDAAPPPRRGADRPLMQVWARSARSAWVGRCQALASSAATTRRHTSGTSSSESVNIDGLKQMLR